MNSSKLVSSRTLVCYIIHVQDSEKKNGVATICSKDWYTDVKMGGGCQSRSGKNEDLALE
jgi:hypothetical protein